MGINVDTTQYASPEVTAYTNENVHQTNQGLADQYTSGNSQARGLLNAPTQTNGFGDSPESAAIRRRAGADYMVKERDVNLHAIRNAEGDHIQRLAAASAMANEEVNLNRQKEMLKYKMQQANKRARGAIVGNVLGIVGGVAGGVLGAGTGVGAVGGAMAGFQLGEGTGQAIGGS